MASVRVIGHVCAVLQASGTSGLVPRRWEHVRVPPLALATHHANRPLQIHWRPRRTDHSVPVNREAVVFTSTKREIAGLRARRDAEQTDGRLSVQQEPQFVAWFEQVLRHPWSRIDLATSARSLVDPVKVQVRLVRTAQTLPVQ